MKQFPEFELVTSNKERFTVGKASILGKNNKLNKMVRSWFYEIKT